MDLTCVHSLFDPPVLLCPTSEFSLNSPPGELGIPQAKGRQVFLLAEELLRAANQNSRLSLPRTQAGWFLLGAWMTLGSAAVRAYMPRMVLMWKNAFPRSSKELDAEKTRGDAFTWQVSGCFGDFRSDCRACCTRGQRTSGTR